MARILIVGGGCRGLQLARELRDEGHAVRITTRTEGGRAPIEAAGAECWIGTPDRIESIRYALDRVTLICWLLGNAGGSGEAAEALHGSRLQMLLARAIDTTVRGIVYEAAGTLAPAVLAGGAELVARQATLNAIPYRLLDCPPAERRRWIAEARAAVGELLQGRSGPRR